MNITIYDFDKTIYDGDSMIDFYLFCLQKKPQIIRHLPFQLWHTLLFFMGLESRTSTKQHFFVFLRSVDTNRYVELFWDKNLSKIKKWFHDKGHDSAVVISASPEFLLSPIVDDLGIRMLIGTRMDQVSGIIEGENCYGAEKVTRLHEELPSAIVDAAYSDSLSDMPLFEIANESYYVHGDTIIKLSDYQRLSLFKRKGLWPF